MIDVELMLAGPRGRGLCAEVGRLGRQEVQDAFWDARRDRADDVSGIVRALATIDLDEVSAIDEPTLMRCLTDSVSCARYWQEPDERDRLLELPQVVEALAPIAERLIRTARPRWWSEPLVPAEQAHVQWLDTYRTEARWWSAPLDSDAVITSRTLLEITGPADWSDLVSAYPLRVTRSRLHDWWRTTGRAGEWFIPDWAAVAADYDAVHVTVSAYLATAGRALPVDGGATVLAGWDPDATFWLTDALRPAGQPATWRFWEPPDAEPGRWVLE